MCRSQGEGRALQKADSEHFFLQIISALQVSINFTDNEVNDRPFSLGVGEGSDYKGAARGDFLLMELLCIPTMLVFA